MATAISMPAPVLPFGQPQEELKPVPVVTTEHSLLKIDREMDVLFDRIQDELEETGEPTYLQVFSPSNPAEANKAFRGFSRFLAINLELFTLVEALNQA
jgi:hypothetical protein